MNLKTSREVIINSNNQTTTKYLEKDEYNLKIPGDLHNLLTYPVFIKESTSSNNVL